MIERVHTASQQPETQVRDLTPDELEQVSAGASSGGVNVLFADGSVRNVDAGDYAVFRHRFGTGV